MPRYIDADELWLQLDKRESFEQGRNRAYYKGLRDAKKVLDEQPTADVVERKKGKWLNYQGNTRIVLCSECRMPALESMAGCLTNQHLAPNRTNFCPTCGADMRGDGNDN